MMMMMLLELDEDVQQISNEALLGDACSNCTAYRWCGEVRDTQRGSRSLAWCFGELQWA